MQKAGNMTRVLLESRRNMKTQLFSITLAAWLVVPSYGQAPVKPAAPAAVKAAAPAAPDLVTRSGKVYKQARVFRVEPDGITYMYVGGMSKIDFTELPDAVRKQYNYDPKAAAAFAQADEAAQAQAQAEGAQQMQTVARRTLVAQINSSGDVERQAAADKAAAADAIKAKAIAANAMVIRATVQQVLDEGVLVSYKRRIGLYGWPEDEEDNWIYVAGLGKKAVDGDKWEGTVYPFGRYQYANANGNQKTVLGYASSAYGAAALAKD